MVLHIRAHVWEIELGWNTEGFEDATIADAAKLKYMRRLDSATTFG